MFWHLLMSLLLLTNQAVALTRLVMDFDCTISQEHLYKTTHLYNDPSFRHWLEKSNKAKGGLFKDMSFSDRLQNVAFAKWIMGGPQRIAMLASKFEQFQTSQGIAVEISTWSEISRVKQVLEHTDLLKYISQIHGVNDRVNLAPVQVWDRNNDRIIPLNDKLQVKQNWIAYLASQGSVVFVDDTSDNYEGLEGVPNVKVFDNADNVLLKDGNGLTRSMMDVITDMMETANCASLRQRIGLAV